MPEQNNKLPQKGPQPLRTAALYITLCGAAVKLVHAAHVTAGGGCRGRGLRQVSDQAFGGQNHSGNAGSILQSGAGDLGRVNNAGFDHIVNIFFLLGVIAVVGLAGLQNVVDDNAAFQASVCGDLAQRSFQSLADDLSASALIAFQLADQLINSGDSVDGSGAATSNDALFNSSLGCVQGVLDAELLILHLNFGSSADLDDSYAASQLGQAFLQLFTVKVRGSGSDLGTDLGNAVSNGLLIASATDDGGVLLANLDLAGAAQQLDGSGADHR